ncbi:MAG: exosortase/archaeosortase family protein [Candidatus Omnitrophica bacterium]|nr:exosortase/archaeosortase family protein [Candidatus Omnitrophota bacterium]
MKPINYIKTAIVLVLLGLIYYPAFTWMWVRWNAEETYYSHGPLIPVAVLFFIWIKKEELFKLRNNSLDAGIICICMGIFMHLVAIWINVLFISAASLIVTLIGLILYFFGKEMLRRVLFPICYFVFMIPLPLFLIANIVVKMKLFAAQMATVVLNKIGIAAIREGSIIHMTRSYLAIESPCSGLRSLISLMAFGAAFAYLTRHNMAKKWVLFLSALPIALLANVLRIVLLGWVSEIYGMEAAQGWIHDFSGYLLFVIAAFAMIAVNSLLGAGLNKVKESKI